MPERRSADANRSRYLSTHGKRRVREPVQEPDLLRRARHHMRLRGPVRGRRRLRVRSISLGLLLYALSDGTTVPMTRPSLPYSTQRARALAQEVQRFLHSFMAWVFPHSGGYFSLPQYAPSHVPDAAANATMAAAVLRLHSSWLTARWPHDGQSRLPHGSTASCTQSACGPPRRSWRSLL